MQSLTIEPTVPFIVRPGPVSIALVGCGGTGSHVGQALARLAAHLRASRQDLRIIFIDGDTVEEKNVGRQLFTPADIGRNKAQCLAARFNHLFGLGIEAVPEMATVDLLAAVGGGKQRFDGPGGRRDTLSILIGCVDTATARRSLHGALRLVRQYRPVWHLWLDSGNHEHSGQVLLGGETDPKQLTNAVDIGLCTRLPAPSLSAPELLAATERRRREDCAAAMEDNAQSLEVNQFMAAIVAGYLNRIIIQRRLEHFETWVDLTAMSMRSTPVSATAIRAVQQRALERQDLLREVDGSLAQAVNRAGLLQEQAA